jgi:hypothetical protein
MKLMRYGAPGSERPVAEHEGARWDISPVTADIDAAFFASGRMAAVTQALAAGELDRFDPACHRVGAPIARPGDLINTGTPAGVALGSPTRAYLRSGDVVRLQIEGLGRAEQVMVAA